MDLRVVMERYQDYGFSSHCGRPHGSGSESGVVCLPAVIGLRCGLRCGEFQVLVGLRAEGVCQSGAGAKNLEIFGSGIWSPLLAPFNYALRSKGPFLVSKFRDSNARKKWSAVLFFRAGGRLPRLLSRVRCLVYIYF